MVKDRTGRRNRRYYVMGDLLADRPHEVGAEIGVQGGRTTHYLLTMLPGIKKYYCVDPWAAYEGYREGKRWFARRCARSYKAFCSRVLADFEDRIVVHRMQGTEAAPLIPDESLDFVFIDGNHIYSYVRQDILDWYPKVKTGGLVAGHDYTLKPPDWWEGGVAKAVGELFGTGFQRVPCNIWWLRKDGQLK